MSLLEDLKKGEMKPTDQKDEVQLPSKEARRITLECKGDDKRSITSGITTDYEISVIYDGSESDKLRLRVDIVQTTSLGEDAAEWAIDIQQKGMPMWEVTRTKQSEREGDLSPNATVDLELRVTSPKGARYGDSISVVLTASLVSDPAVSDTLTTSTTAKQSVLAVKTQIGHERTVADTLASRAADMGVLSILCPAPLRGYVLVEAMNTDRLTEVVRSIKRARGIVQGEMKFDEIEHYLTPKPLVAGIVEGDIVELVAGPFKGEKARVQHIDEPKEEITVELFEALVPIPVTVKGDSVRVIEKEK